MAFWGVEVKPGKPYTHRYDPSHGRLRICQATLGSCDAASRTVLQCNVGNATPVKLCSLNPKMAEMCHLEIELEEDSEVLFSVLGQSSVHLSGYYLRSSSRSNAGDDESESFGEDVGESDTDEEYNASEDSYESDFIDDGDVECGSDSIDDGDVCSTPDRFKQKASKKHAGKVERRRRLKKKHQFDSTNENNDDSPSKPAARRKACSIFDSGSEDEDSISVPVTKKDGTEVSEEIKPENIQSNGETRKKSKGVKKRKREAISQNAASPTGRDVTEANGSPNSKHEAGIKKSKKRKKTPLEPQDGKHSNVRTLENGLIIEDLSTGSQDAKTASKGNKVYIKYVGKLQDGKVVESNLNEKPYKFKLGDGEENRGWDDGICGMHVGDKRRLTIPPSICSKNKSVGKLPENSSIIYEVELVKVR